MSLPRLLTTRILAGILRKLAGWGISPRFRITRSQLTQFKRIVAQIIFLLKGVFENLKNFIQEFKAFALKGSMLDMAVGIIIGGAFTALISSIVANIATPLIGILIGVDFSSWKIQLPRLYGNVEPGTLDIGIFLNSVISFIIIALIVFLFVRAMNRIRSKQESSPDAPPAPSAEEKLLAEIRDILKDSANSNIEN